MNKLTLMFYLVGGYPVGHIARDMGSDRATVRGELKDCGINLRPDDNGYSLGRDPVCDAVRRLGYKSFHDYAQVNGLEPITSQADSLGVPSKLLARVYKAYRSLLIRLKAAGVTLPTSQMSGVELERSEERADR